jgi:hypothetical protein
MVMAEQAIVDDYSWWRDALATGSFTVEEGNPQVGFYKTKRNNQWVPVAIWRNKASGELVAAIANKSNAIAPNDIWLSCAKFPVSNDAAKVAFATGLFPGDVAPLGNNASALPIVEQIGLVIDEAVSWLKSIGGKIATSVESNTIANYRDQLNGLKKKAEAEHKAEKQPFLDGGRDVDAKFNPAVKSVTETVRDLLAAQTVYLNAENKRVQDEARAKHEAEVKRVAAERSKIAAEQAEKMKVDPIAALTSAPVDEPELPIFYEPKPVSAGGQFGKKTTLRTVTEYVITNYAVALESLKNHPDVVAAVEKAAKAQAKAGVTVPGVETVIKKVAA